MAVYTPVKLFQAQVPVAEATQYTVPAATKVIVKEILITVTGTVAVVFGLSLVPSSGTAGVSNRVIPDQYFNPGVADLSLSTVMNAGDFISIKAGVSNVVNVYVSGVTVV